MVIKLSTYTVDYGVPPGTDKYDVPFHLAVDDNGFAFDTDYYNCQVTLLSPTLEYVRQVVSRDQQNSWPKNCILIHNDYSTSLSMMEGWRVESTSCSVKSLQICLHGTTVLTAHQCSIIYTNSILALTTIAHNVVSIYVSCSIQHILCMN